MKEIGGYLEFETYHGFMLHENAILLNSGRSCLAYLIEAKGIHQIAMPYYMCKSVFDICNKYGVKIRYYLLNDSLRPDRLALGDNEWLYLMNYYGQLTTKEIESIAVHYKRVIVDFTHDYFHDPIPGVDTLYSCRKYFGVSDGGILYSDSVIKKKLSVDESFDRIRFLVGRFERSASEYYAEASANNNLFADEPIKRMSKLTQNLLRGIDYQEVKKRRTNNYQRLHERLGTYNQLNVRLVEGPYAYPLFIENGSEIRRALIKDKIYVATLWPNVLEMSEDSIERRFALNILPLPCDQRYMEDDMEVISDKICNLIEQRGAKN